jgi:hypothetical protein
LQAPNYSASAMLAPHLHLATANRFGTSLPGETKLFQHLPLLLVKDSNVVERSSIRIEACRRYRKCLAVAGQRVAASLHDLSALRQSPANGMIINRRIDGRIPAGSARDGMRL